MPKVTLDMSTFKALASDTRLDILRTLDGKKMSLNDICRETKLNKATLHEHLQKLNQAGLIKRKEREGHKWVYYKLTWKGEGLLHPENTKIVVMFSVSFITLSLAIMLLVSFAQPITVGMARTYGDTTLIYEADNEGASMFSESYNYNYITTIKSVNQTVDNFTVALQSRGQIENALGITYAAGDFKWEEVPETSTYGHLSLDLSDIDKLRNITGWNNTADDNDTNDSENKELIDGGTIGSLPPVAEMIATVQDITFLYLAVVCLSFFGALFILSTWRFWKNRIPKL